MSNAISAEIELGDYIMIFTGDGEGVMGWREVSRGGGDRGGERLLEMWERDPFRRRRVFWWGREDCVQALVHTHLK